MRDPIVLVADDEAINRTFVRATLAAAGWTVLEEADGDEAVSAARTLLPNLIVMDINMPQADGWKATAAIRAAGAPLNSVPILAYTTMTLGDDAVRAAGMDGRVPKPCTPEILAQAAARWRPDGQLAKAEQLAAIFGAAEIERLLRSFRGQLEEAIERLDDDDPSQIAHRVGGAAGTLGFSDVSASWLRLSEGDASARGDARRSARLAISEIDRKLASGGPREP